LSKGVLSPEYQYHKPHDPYNQVTGLQRFSSWEVFAPVLSFAADFPSLCILSVDTPLTLPNPHGALKYVNFLRPERLDLCACETEPIFDEVLSLAGLKMLRVRNYCAEHCTYWPITCLNAFLHKTDYNCMNRAMALPKQLKTRFRVLKFCS
jgi:hypothetical protein